MLSEVLKFRISSELKTLIGKELITDDNIAIFELVKNAFDAYAKNVIITFKNTRDPKKAKIFIHDDGTGMSKEDLERKWLFVGFSEKREIEEELKNKNYRDLIGKRRIFAGAKGIGRFSCDKLGKKVRMFTKVANQAGINVLEVNWEKFEGTPTSEFQTIEVSYEKINKLNLDIEIEKFDNGTILEISPLRTTWDRKRISELKRHLQRLINPMQIGSQDFSIILEANEYLVDDEKYRKAGEDYEIVNGPITNIIFEKLDIKTTNISCVIDSYGQKVTTELYDKGKFIFSMEEKNEYIDLHDVSIKVFYLNKSAKITFTKNMGLEPRSFGSIFFYKNGIKISPLGDFGDDWLGLDSRKAQGTRRFFGTREILGRIEVNGYQPFFTEVSSRDGGVVRTPQLDLLRRLFFEKALRRLERYVIEGLGWDSEEEPKDPDEVRADTIDVLSRIVGRISESDTRIRFNEDLLKIVKEKELEKTDEIIRNLKELKKYVPSKDVEDYVDTQITTLKTSFRALKIKKEEAEKQLEITQSQNIFLRKITDEEKDDIINLQHHIKIATGTMIGHLMGLKEATEREKQVSKEELLSIIDSILLETSLIQSVVLYVTKASFDVKKAMITKDLIQFVKQYIENVHNEKISSGPKVIVSVKPENTLFVNKFSPLELIMIIDNLIDNAEKAQAKNVQIFINKTDEKTLELKVKDDGKGINQLYFAKLFELGFSTTGGSGIGLYSIKKIADANGWIISVNKTQEKGAEFILSIKKSLDVK